MTTSYSPKSFTHLIGMPGFSEKLLRDHFTLYEGYVKNTNTLVQELEDLARADKTAKPEYGELKRRFGWEFDGMRLHESYFGNMTVEKGELSRASSLSAKIAADFGSVEAWTKDFKGTGAIRGIGWAALVWDPAGNRLFNVWVNEHSGGHLAGCSLVMLMDVFEHAFMTDYGTKRADYIEAFFGAIDWKVLESRFESARTASPVNEPSPVAALGVR